MGILDGIKHLAPLFLYLASILFILKAIVGDGRWAFLLATFLVPLRNINEKIIDFPLGAHLLYILAAGAFLGWLISHVSHKNPKIAPSNLNKIAAIFVIYVFISLVLGSFYTGYFYFSFSESRVQDGKTFYLMALLFFISLNYITEKKWIYRTLITMGLATILMEYYTCNQILEYPSLISREKIHGTFEFLGPNEVAAFFNEYTAILMGIFLYIKEKKIKLLLFIMICINIFCILFLYSRGAYLGLFAGIFFICLFKNRKFLIPLIFVILFWQSILPEKVIERIELTTSNDGQLDSSSQRRIDIWKQAMELFQKSPLTGIGLGNFRTLGLDLGDTHNIYVKYLVEQGVIGLTVFLILIFCFLRMGYILYKKGDDDLSKGIGLGFMSCIIILIVNNFFGDRWSHLELSAYLWIFAGLVARLIIIAQNPEPLSETQKKEKTAPTPLVQKQKKKLRYYDL